MTCRPSRPPGKTCAAKCVSSQRNNAHRAHCAHCDVLDAAVVGLPDKRLGEVPVAAVELRAGATGIDEAALREHARGTLVSHHIPVRIMVLDSLPRTSSLKTDLGPVRRLFAKTEV